MYTWHSVYRIIQQYVYGHGTIGRTSDMCAESPESQTASTWPATSLTMLPHRQHGSRVPSNATRRTTYVCTIPGVRIPLLLWWYCQFQKRKINWLVRVHRAYEEWEDAFRREVTTEDRVLKPSCDKKKCKARTAVRNGRGAYSFDDWLIGHLANWMTMHAPLPRRRGRRRSACTIFVCALRLSILIYTSIKYSIIIARGRSRKDGEKNK